MRGPRRAFHSLRQLFLDDIRAEASVARRVHFFIGWREKDVHAFDAAEFFVTREIARVTRQILLRPKLSGIDVNADDHHAAPADDLPRATYKTHVAFVQIAHRWHQADAYAAGLPAFGQPLHGIGRRNNPH